QRGVPKEIRQMRMGLLIGYLQRKSSAVAELPAWYQLFPELRQNQSIDGRWNRYRAAEKIRIRTRSIKPNIPFRRSNLRSPPITLNHEAHKGRRVVYKENSLTQTL